MRFCFDLDNTLCELKQEGQSYSQLDPKPGAVRYLQKLAQKGHYIIIYTARHMATCGGNLGRITALQAPTTIAWLAKHQIPYDELLFGKPLADYYIDDKAIAFTDFSTLEQHLPLT